VRSRRRGKACGDFCARRAAGSRAWAARKHLGRTAWQRLSGGGRGNGGAAHLRPYCGCTRRSSPSTIQASSCAGTSFRWRTSMDPDISAFSGALPYGIVAVYVAFLSSSSGALVQWKEEELRPGRAAKGMALAREKKEEASEEQIPPCSRGLATGRHATLLCGGGWRMGKLEGGKPAVLGGAAQCLRLCAYAASHSGGRRRFAG